MLDPISVSGTSYLLAVHTALVSLDGDELLAADRETTGESLVAGGVGGDQGVDLFLGELEPTKKIQR